MRRDEMHEGFSALLLLSSALQHISESPTIVVSSRTNLGILAGTQGDISKTREVGLAYATGQKLSLDNFRTQFLASGSSLGRGRVSPLFLPGDMSTVSPSHMKIDITTGQNCRVVAWLYVPLFQDFVLVSLYWHTVETPKDVQHFLQQIKNVPFFRCIRFPGIISYIMPGGQELEKGLFYWYSDWVNENHPDLIKTKKIQGSVHPNGKLGQSDRNNRHPNDRAVREWLFNIAVDRNQIFEYIMCMSEEKFRKDFNIIKPNTTLATAAIKRVVATLPLDKQVLFPPDFEQKFATKTVRDLRKKYINNTDNRACGKLFIMKRSVYGYETDIRYLQSRFPDAVFQIASTLCCLEGGVRDYVHPLRNMNHTPVQGENAVLATLPAAMTRRYCIEPYQRNLLIDVAEVFKGAEHNSDPGITDIRGKLTYDQLLQGSETNKKSQENKPEVLQLALSGAMRVGVHQDVYVHSGSFDQRDILISRANASFSDRQVPAFDRWLPHPVKIHQIYTSALNLSPHQMQDKGDILKMLHRNDDVIPKIVLRAMYEGTILAAYDLLKDSSHMGEFAPGINDFLEPDRKMPRLFLTLVGGGAFSNKSQWIVDIIHQLQALIKKTNLQVCIVVWDFGASSDWMKPLASIASAIETGNLENLSQDADKNAREKLWLFNNKEAQEIVQASVTLPIRKYDAKRKELTTEYVSLKVVGT